MLLLLKTGPSSRLHIDISILNRPLLGSLFLYKRLGSHIEISGLFLDAEIHGEGGGDSLDALDSLDNKEGRRCYL
jgi:hypothetical protein